MSSKVRKRSRAEAEENRADCPFVVTMAPPPASGRDERDGSGSGSGGGGGAPRAKKRKSEVADEERKKPHIQLSPFEPAGKFRTHETMDIHYLVEPRKKWLDMTRYNSFVLNGTKYYSEGFVYVANEVTIERQRSGKDGKIQLGTNDYWVARILEVRAADEHHVYARVFWMYSPDELPPNTLDGRRSVAGRQPHHGTNELIASNHMDVINVVSVVMPATVNQWIESDDDEVQDALYWRQALDCRTSQLSSVEITCKCQTPANPDKTLIGCTNNACGQWLHYECLLDDVLARLYERLGTDRPHIEQKPVKKEDESEGDKHSKLEPQAPLSPTEPKGEDTQPTIAVRGSENSDSNGFKPSDEEAKPAKPAKPTAATLERQIPAAEKKPGKKRRASAKLHRELFEATLRMDDGPVVWEVKDLRDVGGAKAWTEAANCLVCGTTIE